MKNFGAERLSMQLPKENSLNITIDAVLGGGRFSASIKVFKGL